MSDPGPAQRMLIITNRTSTPLTELASRHGYTPTVSATVPDLEDIVDADNIAVDADTFSDLPLDSIGEHDIGLWLIDDGDPWEHVLTRRGQLLKRTIDVAIAATILLVLTPVLLAVALAIKLDSSGPIFHQQNRLGRNGRWFQMHKFRTMHTANDASKHADYFVQLAKGEAQRNDGLYKLVDDPRITRVGKTLRRFSIDEVPQFFDVLRGAMSVVGPRPMLPRELRTLDGHSWKRQSVKPGITGLWQVSGRATTTFDTMIELDIDYARNWSARRELTILLGTPAAILREETA